MGFDSIYLCLILNGNAIKRKWTQHNCVHESAAFTWLWNLELITGGEFKETYLIAMLSGYKEQFET